ncbi:MAG: D-alanyl-D-alanine carboxypeptidase/D-alanyl-D-alanine endopeptidase [Sulfitobacter sp.]
MTEQVTRRRFLGASFGSLLSAGVAAGALGQAAAAEPTLTSLRPVMRRTDLYKRAVPSVAEILAQKKLTGNVAFAVADAATGAALEAKSPLKPKPPASVTKAITALYALEALGPDHQFETGVYVTGGVSEGEVQGDLILVGGGDPTLDTDRLASLAANLKEAGIIGVKGAYKVYDGALPVIARIDPEQPDHVGYNPGVSGLALNYNRVHFEWKRGGNGYTVTMDARSEKYRPDVVSAAMRVIDRASPVYTYSDGGVRDDWTVARGALGGGGSRWLPVRKPGLYAADVFATMARANGIDLGKPQIEGEMPQGAPLVRDQSAPLRVILRDMLKYSTNLTAEMVGMAATKQRLGQVSDLRGSAAEMNAWAALRLGMKAPALVDHSGLGDDSTLTPADMVKALVTVQATDFRDILKPFWMRDEKRRVIQDHPVRVDAKTGTLNFASTLAGYVTAKDGRVMAFAIFAADEGVRAKITRAQREGPAGGAAWNRRAKEMQQALIERWAVLYGEGDA